MTCDILFSNHILVNLVNSNEPDVRIPLPVTSQLVRRRTQAHKPVFCITGILPRRRLPPRTPGGVGCDPRPLRREGRAASLHQPYSTLQKDILCRGLDFNDTSPCLARLVDNM